MAKVFLDTNVFIDIVENRRNITAADIAGHQLFISPLSIHIVSYLYKYKMPEKKLDGVQKIFTIVSWDLALTLKALLGPTKDFEDNVQLNSAATYKCDYFLTHDKKLLKLKSFAKTIIVASLNNSPITAT
ncbi:PIN domain-containing protein [Candidatus Microgenomates bacterium]|nr:MAG: PIN domain-containing protein [Candidatus Microgenomates bacterium]